MTNVVFIIASDDEAVVTRIAASVRPLLARSGGVCLISDALWPRH